MKYTAFKGTLLTDEATDRLPVFLTEELTTLYGDAAAARIFTGYNAERPTTFRVNTLQASADEVLTELTAAGFLLEQVSWYTDAYIIQQAGNVSLWDTAAIKQGKIYVQSLSSMLPALFLDAKPGADVLDMCAAPGGKTTQIAALGAGRIHLTACEQNPVRAEKLEYNLKKQGAANVLVMKQDARRLDSFFSFDRVLLDAPCSGSGTLHAGDPKLAKRFSQALVKDSCKKQAALLAKALEIVKPGGALVYSTCSILKCENEEIVSSALQRAGKRGSYKVEALDLDGFEQVPTLPSTLEGALTVCPTDLFEGFFMVKIRRYQ